MTAVVPLSVSGGDDNDANSEAHPPGGWRFESQRWLATLNPGRTQREYQKAVTYFFVTPGVPQQIAALTFDLLLAYRGALAMRATAHTEIQPRRSARSGPRTRLSGVAPAQLEGQRGDAAEATESSASGGVSSQNHLRALSPATVNIRLTALRQFLVYCALYGSAISLTPDQIRAALRRLSVERRRPYQTLAEPEWAQFLAAARLPAERQSSPAIGTQAESRESAHPTGPWGVPRAVREEARQLAEKSGRLYAEALVNDAVDAVDEEQTPPKLIRSKAGLTGERTAPRDHALLALALATGLRAIELASLDVSDLSREWRAGQEEWWLVLPDSKTKGQSGGRTLPLAPELVEILRDYLEVTGRHWERPEDRGTPLFLSGVVKNQRAPQARVARQRAGETSEAQPKPVFRRLSPGQIRLIVDRVETQWQALYEGADRKHGRRSGDSRRISPHALRHSTAIALLEGNQTSGRPPASVEHVRGWLGHLDIRTTQGYLAHLDARRHRRPFTLSPAGGNDGSSVISNGESDGTGV
ncbi:MAG TPA: site-specific integrase [Ktedonobacterales bacterium]|jgi:integrase